MLYHFNRDVTVEGVSRREGEIVDESEIPVGCMDCLIRLEHIREFTPPAVDSVESENTSPKVKKNGVNRQR